MPRGVDTRFSPARSVLRDRLGPALQTGGAGRGVDVHTRTMLDGQGGDGQERGRYPAHRGVYVPPQQGTLWQVPDKKKDNTSPYYYG